ncbi:MAG: SpoIIE family protein phosphatase [Candidatus Fermentibacteraceae bacterium]|nr:SpoIIE family protein phosphatase [Candidatus Fermentibacteraceae bacterium]MBN2607588.1 SpoIIE family protein phosphatase [Candidatus Fermentibacteraceae bacterium]
MLKKVIVAFTLVVMLSATGFCALYLVREYTKVYRITHIGDMWSFVRMDANVSFAPFVEIDRDDFPHPPYPQRGDLLVAVDGRPANEENYFRAFSMDTPAGRTIEIMFMHAGEINTTDIVTRTIPGPLKLQIWTMFILRTLIAVSLLFTGIWGMVRRRASAAVRALSLFCSALAVQMALSSTIVAHLYASFQIPAPVLIAFTILGLSSSSFWLKLNLLFPRMNSMYERYRLAANVLIFLPILIIGVWSLASGRVAPLLVISIYHTVFLTGGFVLLIRNFKRARSFIERRQTRLVLMGSFIGIVLYIMYGWFRFVMLSAGFQLPVQTNMLIVNIVFLLLLPIPVSIVYAFRKYMLLEVEGKLRRGTRFLVVNLSLLLAFFGFLYMFGEFVLQSIGISSQTPTLVLGLMLALAFLPTQRKLRIRVEDYFYPEKKRLRELLRDFLASSIVRTEETSFWEDLQDKLAYGLAAEKIYPVLRMEHDGDFTLQNREPVPFSIRDQLLEKLMSRDDTILIDEAVESGRILLTDEQKEWFECRKCAVILPLTVSSGLVGFLVISSKTNGEDFTSEELELLSSFSAQIALVAENIQLLRERIEKQKLEEQLSVAREIQEGLLPGEIPQVPGLEVRALIRFCLDVAGDYFDVMTLGDGRILVAVADVAGKGVGSALLMANLQASLRTTREMGATLSESASRINTLIFDNTPSDMFITFFAACFDPNERRMSYVNAGHNPPILLRKTGESRKLTGGGLLFGVVRETGYEEVQISFEKGDAVLLYTDGVSEAMDPSGEEFGEERIESILRENPEMDLQVLLERIEQRVEVFHGSSGYSDDFTLLAVRAT